MLNFSFRVIFFFTLEKIWAVIKMIFSYTSYQFTNFFLFFFNKYFFFLFLFFSLISLFV